jgi:vitamin B12 transporter
MRLLSRFGVAVLLGLASLGLPGSALAQPPLQLPGIYVESPTISARPVRAPEPPAPAAEAPTTEPAEASGGIPLDRVGSAISVVTAQDLERQQVENAHDALRSLPGVSVSQQGTTGNLTVVRIRGAESRHTLVVIDGVEVNSGTDGFFDFSNLSAADVERIEVLRGPQSGLYGNSALGGVVSITTKSGRGPLALSLKTEAGTQRTGSATAQLSGGSDTAWGSVVVHGFNTDGFNISTAGDEGDGARIRSFAARGGVALSESFKIEGTLREHNTRADFDQGFGGLLKGFDVPKDAAFVGDARLRVGSLQATLDTFNKTWTHNVYVQGTETVREDLGSSLLLTNSTNSKFGYKSTLLLEPAAAAPFRHFVTAMVERRTETFQQPTFTATEFTRDRNTVAGEVRGEYFKSLFLTGTVRHDQNTDTQDFTTWHISGSYLVPGGVFRLHGSAGTGVKYPSFGDLYGFFFGFEPNAGLVPEESFGYDFGVETKFFGGRALLDITYFHADLTNEIDLACNAAFMCKPFNRSGPSTRSGVEVAGRYAVTPQLTLGAAYTYLHAEEDDGLQEIRRPRHGGRIDANYVFQQGRGNVNVAAIYNGTMRDEAFFPFPPGGSARVSLDDYWLLRLAASYKLQPGVELFGRVENLLDQHYQEVLGYNATPGIAAFAGIKLTFGGPEGYGGSWAK